MSRQLESGVKQVFVRFLDMYANRVFALFSVKSHYFHINTKAPLCWGVERYDSTGFCFSWRKRVGLSTPLETFCVLLAGRTNWAFLTF